RRDLPAVEFLAHVVDIRQLDVHDWLSSLAQRFHLLRLLAIRLARQAEINEDPVAAINVGRGQGLAIDRDETLALLASALGQELFQPCAEVLDSRRGNNGHLVAAKIAESAKDRAQDRAGVLLGWTVRPASVHHLLSAVEELAQIETHDGRGNHAEVGERRVPAADAGQTEEDFAETIALRHLLHFGAGIGDGDKTVARSFPVEYLLHAGEEVLLEDVGLQRAAGLAGDDEQR